MRSGPSRKTCRCQLCQSWFPLRCCTLILVWLLRLWRYRAPREQTVGNTKPPGHTVVGPEEEHQRHEEEVSPDPSPADREDEKEAELRKELENAYEECERGQEGGEHATENAYADDLKSLLCL